VNAYEINKPGGDRVHKVWCWVELSEAIGVVI
jgi:hypothetical protein